MSQSFVERKREEAEAALPDDPSFDDYLEPHGEWDLPIYTGFPDDSAVVRRVVERRAEWLEAQDEYGLNERLAHAIAWKEATGKSASGLARVIDVTPSTASGYMDRIRDNLGYDILAQEPFHEIDRPLPTGGPNLRECPNCGEEHMCAIEEIPRVFTMLGGTPLGRAFEGAKTTGATHLCTSCHEPQKIKSAADDAGDAPDVTGFYTNVPDGLQAVDRWIVWEDRSVGPDDVDRTRKMPIAPWATDGMQIVNGHNPYVWTRFAEAADWATKTPAFGLMFVIRPDDPFVLLDLDDCVEDGDISEAAREIIQRFDSYAEFSPSGSGVHVICTGSVPPGYRNVEGFEIYDGARLCTFTGNVVHNQPVADAGDAIEWFCDAYLDEGTMPAIGGTGEAHHALAGIKITDLFPDLPLDQNVEHPVHGSTQTGANFRLHPHNGGESATCWRCDVGVNAAHLIAMEVHDVESCAEIRDMWRQDDEVVLRTWVHAVKELGVDPNPPPSRAIACLARQVGVDPDDDYKLAWDMGTKMASRKWGFDVETEDGG